MARRKRGGSERPPGGEGRVGCARVSARADWATCAANWQICFPVTDAREKENSRLSLDSRRLEWRPALRKVSAAQILVFSALLLLSVIAAAATSWLLFSRSPLGDFRGVTLLTAFVLLLYLYSLAIYRLLVRAFPLRPGEIAPGSTQEFVYHVYLMFFMMLFYPVMRSGFVPVPLMRPFYQALGAKMGANTYSSGIIFDPLFVELGANTLVGQYALIVPHVIEGERLAHYPIRIGSAVTIGAGATVLAGVTIGDNAIVATGAVVMKDTQIPSGEVWGGVPARSLGQRSGGAGVA